MATDSEINKDMFLEINANDSRNQVKTVVKLSKVWAEIADVRSDEMPDVARLKNGGSTTDVSWLEGKTTLSSGSIGFSPNPWSFGNGSINCSKLWFQFQLKRSFSSVVRSNSVSYASECFRYTLTGQILMLFIWNLCTLCIIEWNVVKDTYFCFLQHLSAHASVRKPRLGTQFWRLWF